MSTTTTTTTTAPSPDWRWLLSWQLQWQQRPWLQLFDVAFYLCRQPLHRFEQPSWCLWLSGAVAAAACASPLRGTAPTRFSVRPWMVLSARCIFSRRPLPV